LGGTHSFRGLIVPKWREQYSHRQYKHGSKPGTVTVAGKPSLDVPPGTLNAILKQAGLKREK
jgi:predicted RNA binding protein YcfA (HicA-like mRNA interferase family)